MKVNTTKIDKNRGNCERIHLGMAKRTGNYLYLMAKRTGNYLYLMAKRTGNYLYLMAKGVRMGNYLYLMAKRTGNYLYLMAKRTGNYLYLMAKRTGNYLYLFILWPKDLHLASLHNLVQIEVNDIHAIFFSKIEVNMGCAWV